MKYAVSIIIPLYNNEEFIEECLDSLLNQTFKNFEIIIVDDGSTDNSFNIVKSYEQKYDFIKVLQQKNQYAGVARNLGMKHAIGEYLLFLDSDDFFEPDMLDKTYNQAIKTDADIVLFDGIRYNNKTKITVKWGGFLHHEYLPYREVFSASDSDIYIYQIVNTTPWTKLFKTSFVKQLDVKFSNTLSTNDLYFTNITLAAAKRISYVNEKFVNYRTNNSKSLQANVGNKKLYNVEILNESFDKLNSLDLYKKNIKRSFLNAVLVNLVYYLNKIQTNKEKVIYYNNELKYLLQKLDLLNINDDYLLSQMHKDNLNYIKGFVNGAIWKDNQSKYSKAPIIEKN